MLYEVITHDPELDQLMKQVKISNQNVVQYEAQYRQALALMDQTHAGLFPSISGNASLTRKGTQSSTENTYSARITSYNVCYTKLLRNKRYT